MSAELRPVRVFHRACGTLIFTYPHRLKSGDVPRSQSAVLADGTTANPRTPTFCPKCQIRVSFGDRQLRQEEIDDERS